MPASEPSIATRPGAAIRAVPWRGFGPGWGVGLWCRARGRGDDRDAPPFMKSRMSANASRARAGFCRHT